MAVNAPQPPDDRETAAIAQALQDVSEKAQLLVREEIELAKTEVAGKVKSLARGAIVGIAGGLFAVVGMLFVLAAITAAIGFRWIKKGAPPTPDMAIQEAKAIRDTVSR